MAKLHIVGAGPGTPEYVTQAARRAVQEAQLVIGAERSLNLFHEDIKGEIETLTAKNINEALQRAADSAKNGKAVALLSTGDSGFSGILESILKRQLGKNVEINVVPGISSVQACAAKLCLCWDDSALFTFHDSVSEEKKRDLAGAVKSGKRVFLLPDPKTFPPSAVAAYLLEAKVDGKISVAVCENLTLPNERIVETTLQEASSQNFTSLCVMVIKLKD